MPITRKLGAAANPAICPPCFDATKHAQQQADGSWGPNVAGITGDNQLTDPQKIDVFRWARIYRPNTTTDPACVKGTAQVLGCFVGVIVGIMALTGVGVYLANRGSSGEHCELQPLNANATEALLQSLREEFPQLVNATLENMNDWYPTIRSNLSELIYRDRAGNILERVCGSAARTLDPVLQLMVVFALLGLHMLLQA